MYDTFSKDYDRFVNWPPGSISSCRSSNSAYNAWRRMALENL